MRQETWERIGTIFHHALALSPAERPRYLDEACSANPLLRAEVEAMLTAHDTAAEVGPEGLLGRTPPAGLTVGAEVGPYRLESLIGRGGMGEVYRAVRVDAQFDQQVAIKVVRPERASAELIRRFVLERQIMARLEHPGIATLLDGGITPSGQPYLVMQFVDGLPITRYVAERGLDLAGRLRLFVTVCDAVQFAHGHLVVHRDLKPSNILVTAEGQPRLLDFGIAKLLDPAAAGSTTGDLLLLTPEHAAPEQFLGNPITTAADVYALGVLLYELLTGTRPFRDVPGPELPRAVCEQTPPPPSAITPVDGDLDQIVMMALRKEPARRYASAGQLGEDVARFLGGWPVIARPDSAGYRLRRFVGRNRAVVTAGLVTAAALVGATGISSWQSARRAAALRTADVERRRATRITDFLLSVFRATNPSVTRGQTVTARELLDRAAERVRGDLTAEPAARADMELAIGRAYAQLGQYRTADSLIGRVAAERRRLSETDSLALATVLEWQARMKLTLGDFRAGIELMKEAIAVRERVAGPTAFELATPLLLIGQASSTLDPLDSSGVARASYDRALALHRAADSVDKKAVANLLRNIGVLLDDQGKTAEALAVQREAVATVLEATDENDPATFNIFQALAFSLQSNGQTDSAIAIHRQLLAARRKVYGPDHPEVTFSLFNLARELGRIGRFDEAEALHRECIALREKIYGPEHIQVGYAVGSFARTLARAERHREAVPLWERAAHIAEAAVGADNIDTIDYLEGLALSLLALGNRHRALATLATMVDRGYRTLDRAEFASLRSDPLFQGLVARAAR